MNNDREGCEACRYFHETEGGAGECCLNPKPQPVEPERPACRYFEGTWL